MHTPHGHRRRILLFAVAVFVPALGLVALTVRMNGQERELGRTRLAEEGRITAAQTRRQLLARLERIKLDAVAASIAREDENQSVPYGDPLVVLVGAVENDRLVLPWEANAAAKRSSELLRERPFADMILRGERHEFVGGRIDSAAASYRQAIQRSRPGAQSGYATLLLARVLAKAGQQRNAAASYATVFSLGASVVDEQGVPLALYAAGPLADAGVAVEPTLDRLRTELDSLRWVPPATLYRMRDLWRRVGRVTSDTAWRVAADNNEQALVARIRRAEQILALRAAVPALHLTPSVATGTSGAEAVWVRYGAEPWLVSLAAPAGTMPPVLVAVRAEDPPNSAEPTPAAESALSSWFYPSVLLLVLSVTLFGAYLLWRDVRRELRLADLRSQFVASVSHELKTPLTAIRMFAETLRMGRAADPNAQAEYLDTIIRESERLTRLVNNVLEFSKIRPCSSGAMPTPPSCTSITACPLRRCSRTSITRLSPEYFMALLSRFRIAWWMASRSAWTTGVDADTSSRTVKPCWASGDSSARAAAVTTSASSVGTRR